MAAKRLLGALLVAGLTLVTVTVAATGDVWAQKSKKKEEGPAADPPMVTKAIALSLPGVTWGMSPKQVGEAIDKIIDDDYRPLYKTTSPGVKMTELDNQVAEEKDVFRRSRIDFGKLPTSLDASPLRGEFTYNNRESLLRLARPKKPVMNLFFIQDRLWKIIEERVLDDTSALGKTFPDAAVKLSTVYGVPGRVQPADGTTRMAMEVDWKDATTHMRAIQRSDTALGLAFEENSTLSNLAALRPNKPAQDNGIDPEVAAAMRPKGSDPGPPPDKKKK